MRNFLTAGTVLLALYGLGCGGGGSSSRDVTGDLVGSGEVIQLACPEGQWQCSDGICLNPEDRCNGVAQCADNSDEDPALCDQVGGCSGDTWECPSGKCIKTSAICDGYPD